MAGRLKISAARIHLTVKGYLPELIYGANDGIVTTVAVIAGVTGAQLPSHVILILGFANLVADGFSMAVAKLAEANVSRFCAAPISDRVWFSRSMAVDTALDAAFARATVVMPMEPPWVVPCTPKVAALAAETVKVSESYDSPPEPILKE